MKKTEKLKGREIKKVGGGDRKQRDEEHSQQVSLVVLGYTIA